MLRSCFFNLLYWRRNIKISCVFIICFGYLFMILAPIKEFVTEVNGKITPWIFPFLTTDINNVLFFLILVVVLLCDVPLLFDYQKYVILRIGKIQWILGQIFYIFLVILLFWISIYLFSVIPFAFNISFSNSWGKILNTLSLTNITNELNISMDFNYKIINNFTPLKATLLSFLLSFLVSSLLGLIILYFNTYKIKMLGIIISIILIFTHHFAYLASGYWVYNISPISWISLTVLNTTSSRTNMPSINTAILILILLIIILTILIIRRMYRKALDLLI